MPATDQVKLLREAAVFLDDGHDIVRATGNDRLSFMQRITSGRIGPLLPGQGGPTLLLDVRGRVLASLLVFVRAKSLRLIAAPGQGADVVAGLAKFAIMDDFEITLEPELASLAVLGPAAAANLAAAGIEVPPTLIDAQRFAHQEVGSSAFGTVWVARGHRCGTDGFCVVAARSARDALANMLESRGTPRLAAELAEAMRIRALEPAAGKEIMPDRFPVEIGLGGAIDHTKGCYVGQETIVRMRDRGIVRKRLVLLRLGGEQLPSAADKLVGEGQAAAGQVTSVAGLAGEPGLALAILANAVPVGAGVRIQHAGTELAADVMAESPPWG